MENPIFKRIQDVLERPCRSKEWFGLAEQAINTVYALGERPDILCDSLIKNLTRRAFSKEARKQPSSSQAQEADPDGMDQDEDEAPAPIPAAEPDGTQGDAEGDDSDKDVGDAFELSQLLFVVGHVAIKHIVYLELVEREWKRQKHEKEQGVYSPF